MMSLLANPLSKGLLAQQGAGGGMSTLFMFAAIMGIFYFIVFAPMRKQRKALQEMIENLKKGDKVITSGGIHGEVVSVETLTVLLKVGDNVRLRISKSAIAGRQGEPETGGN